MIYCFFSRIFRFPPIHVHVSPCVPDRRQFADVPRLSRDARRRPERPRRQDHARGLHLRDDAAQADSGSSAAVHRAPRSICPGATFRDDLVSDYKANRAPMPPDLAEQIPWVHEACEALGVPDHHLRALRGRRRDRHAGDEGGGGGLRGRDRHRRQGLLSAGARRHQGLQPARRRHLVRRRRA